MIWRNITCAAIFVGLNVGMLLGSGMIASLKTLLTADQYIDWGWRIAFYFGGLLGFVGLILRKKLSETPVFLEFQASNSKSIVPIKQVFTHYFKQVIQGVGLVCLSAVHVYLLYIFMPTYLIEMKFFDSSAMVNLLNTANIIVYSITTLTMGYLADRYLSN